MKEEVTGQWIKTYMLQGVVRITKKDKMCKACSTQDVCTILEESVNKRYFLEDLLVYKSTSKPSLKNYDGKGWTGLEPK